LNRFAFLHRLLPSASKTAYPNNLLQSRNLQVHSKRQTQRHHVLPNHKLPKPKGALPKTESLNMDKRGVELQRQADKVQAGVDELVKSLALAVQEFTSRNIILNTPKIEAGTVRRRF